MSDSNSDQDAVIAFLASPESHDGAAVELIDTHISHVFLAGDKAYKLKKAVKLDFLDFSTPEKRRRACKRELELNRRLSPELYLDVEPVTRTNSGFALDGSGEPVDWVVVMKRFGQDELFDHLAREGKLTPDLIARLADRVADLHGEIEVRSDLGGADAMTSSIRNAFEALESAPASGLGREAEEDLCTRLLEEVRKQTPLLEARRRGGKVRYCHGDMHLANICLHEGEPTLFDCIEFDDSIACIDILYDVAFPIMDLVAFDEPALANQLMNRYLELSGDYSGVALMAAVSLGPRGDPRDGARHGGGQPEIGQGEAGAPLFRAERVVPRCPRGPVDRGRRLVGDRQIRAGPRACAQDRRAAGGDHAAIGRYPEAALRQASGGPAAPGGLSRRGFGQGLSASAGPGRPMPDPGRERDRRRDLPARSRPHDHPGRRDGEPLPVQRHLARSRESRP